MCLTITLILLGKGWVYRSEWHWDRRSFLVEHPKQHVLKLRKHVHIHFLLVQFYTALKISGAETQEYFSFSNRTHSLDCKLFGESLQQLEEHHRFGFIRPPFSLDIGLKQWSLWILFLKFLPRLLWGTDIFILLKHFFFIQSLHRSLVSRQKQARTFLRITKRFNTSRIEVVEVSCCSWVIFVLCAIFIFVHAFPS